MNKYVRFSFFVFLFVLVILISFFAFRITGYLVLEDVMSGVSYSEVGYGPPFDVFDNNKLIFTISPEHFNALENPQIGVNIEVLGNGYLIWRKAKYYDFLEGAWKEFELNGNIIKESSGQNTMCEAQLIEGIGCDNTKGKITSDMKQQSTFVGWDFSNIWNIINGETYPFFR